MIENAAAITQILVDAQTLMRAALTDLHTDPAAAEREMQSALSVVQSVRGFLL